MPVLSMTATWNSPIADGAAETIQLYCVQTQAVQQYTLHPELCCPDADALASAPSPAPVPHGLVGFRSVPRRTSSPVLPLEPLLSHRVASHRGLFSACTERKIAASC